MPTLALRIEALSYQSHVDALWLKTRTELEVLNREFPNLDEAQLLLADHLFQHYPHEPWVYQTYEKLAVGDSKLAKKAAAHGVSDDIHGLEDHELYLKKTPNQQNEPQTQQEPEVILGVPVEGIIEPSPVPSDNTGQNVDTYDECDSAKPSAKESSKANEEDEPPHLDLFV